MIWGIIASRTFLTLLLLLHFYGIDLYGNECGIEVRFLQSITHALPGQVVAIQAEIINRKPSGETIFVSHLNLPPLWKAIPANDLLLHAHCGQAAIQTVTIQIPETVSPGAYRISYEVWAQKNINILDRDDTVIVVGELADKTDPITLEITSPSLTEINPGEVLYLSALVSNPHPLPFDGKLLLSCPNEWSFTPPNPLDFSLEPEESQVLIYALKVPSSALAGEHAITLGLEGCRGLQRSVVVLIKPRVAITGKVEGIRDAFSLNQHVQLSVRYTNSGNIPLKVIVETQTEPYCELQCFSTTFEILPYETIEIPIIVKTDTQLEQFSQFLLVRLVDAETGEQLYQNPMTLNFMAPGTISNDPYVRIPAYFRTLMVSDHNDYVFGVECAGGGLIDVEEDRYLDFFFRLPTQTRNILYNIDQRMFVGIQDREWNVLLGDTVYELSPLTQRYRYGRGAGIQHAWDDWSAGVHCTKNTVSSHFDPKEICGYVEYHPLENWSLALNYMNKSEASIPTSNIVTLQSDIEFPNNVICELEAGKNFVDSQRDNYAYRFETDVKLWRDSWFNLQNVYAGPDFFGYYQHIRLLTSSLDVPISCRWRLNFNFNQLRQNFDPECHINAIIPKQHQFDACLTYRFNPLCSLSFNGLLLRARDLGEFDQYNFNQRWGGVSFSAACRGYILNTTVSFGQQRNYRSHHTTNLLQRYYIYLAKDFSQKFSGSLFYDGGNTNYYDAGPWRNTYGGSISYRYSPRQWFELFAQRVRQSHDYLDLSQVACNFTYIFKNLHVLQGTIQYYGYSAQSNYPDDTIILITYTMPFQMPVCRRKDIGVLAGAVYDTWNHQYVNDALVSCGQLQTATEGYGSFSFPCVASGEQKARVDLLPEGLISTAVNDVPIHVRGGTKTLMVIPVIPSCSIQGTITLYGFKDIFAVLNNPHAIEVVPQQGLESIGVAIEREESNEIYTATTNAKGEFRFNKLRPGVWRIRIRSDQIPDNHALDFNDLILEVRPSEEANIAFNVKPIAPQVYKLSEEKNN